MAGLTGLSDRGQPKLDATHLSGHAGSHDEAAHLTSNSAGAVGNHSQPHPDTASSWLSVESLQNRHSPVITSTSIADHPLVAAQIGRVASSASAHRTPPTLSLTIAPSAAPYQAVESHLRASTSPPDVALLQGVLSEGDRPLTMSTPSPHSSGLPSSRPITEDSLSPMSTDSAEPLRLDTASPSDGDDLSSYHRSAYTTSQSPLNTAAAVPQLHIVDYTPSHTQQHPASVQPIGPPVVQRQSQQESVPNRPAAVEGRPSIMRAHSDDAYEPRRSFAPQRRSDSRSGIATAASQGPLPQRQFPLYASAGDRLDAPSSTQEGINDDSGPISPSCPSGSFPTQTSGSTSASRSHAHYARHQVPIASSSTMRYVDPDTHWLSEDEGNEHSRDMASLQRGGVRRARTRPSDSQGDDQYGGNADDALAIPVTDSDEEEDPWDFSLDSEKGELLQGAPDGSKAQAAQSHRSQAQVQHGPALAPTGVAMAPDTATAYARDYRNTLPRDEALRRVPAVLLAGLQCPTCRLLMRDPTTLACGHSLCLSCCDDQETSSSGKAPIPSPSTSPKQVTKDVLCPISTCRKLTKAQTQGRDALRVDYVLQKLTDILKVHLITLQSEVSFDTLIPTSLFESQQALLDLNIGSSGDTLESKVMEKELSASPNWSLSSIDDAPKTDGSGKRGLRRRPTDGSATELTSGQKLRKAFKRSKAVASPPATNPIMFAPIEQQETLKLPLLEDFVRPPTPPLSPFMVEVLSELECQVCVTLMYEPMNTSCGHTFCKRCLFRSLDHSSRCPLCRSELPGFNFFVTAPVNLTLHSILQTAFPAMYQERKLFLQQEEGDSRFDTAVFVCMVSFPLMPTNLHIYEPKYRLMMRRAVDVNRRFGMVMPSRAHGGFSQYGTMLEIKNMHVFDDGRSIVESVGVHRFKVLESGSLDGYVVARTARIEDIDDEQELELERLALARNAVRLQTRRSRRSSSSSSVPRLQSTATAQQTNAAGAGSLSPRAAGADGQPPTLEAEANAEAAELSNKELIDLCKEFVDALRTGSTPWLLQRLNSTLPPMPDTPREFTWWMAMLMPIDDHEKARLLQVSATMKMVRKLLTDMICRLRVIVSDCVSWSSGSSRCSILGGLPEDAPSHDYCPPSVVHSRLEIWSSKSSCKNCIVSSRNLTNTAYAHSSSKSFQS